MGFVIGSCAKVYSKDTAEFEVFPLLLDTVVALRA